VLTIVTSLSLLLSPD